MDPGFFSSVGAFKLTDVAAADNDFTDRLNYYYTSMVIILFTVIVSAKQYVGQPLQCWVPAEFNGQWEAYAEKYCWVKNTYFIPMNQSKLPDNPEHRKTLEINYYQYVPFILALQALLFNIPNVFWKIMNWRSGIKIKTLVQGAAESMSADPDKRTESVSRYTKILEDALSYSFDDKDSKSRLNRGIRGLWSCLQCKNVGSLGTYLTAVYIIHKILFVVNVVGQLFLLNHFLSSSYTVFGIRLLIDLIQGREWEISGVFPRVTMCDFSIRTMNIHENHDYSLHCVLMINLFNEKIYIFLWFLFVIVAIANILSLVTWVFGSFGFAQRRFIIDYLDVAQTYDESQHETKLESFAHKHLKNDGIFVLRLIASNAGHVITTELVNQLWTNYLAKEDIKLKPKIINDFS